MSRKKIKGATLEAQCDRCGATWEYQENISDALRRDLGESGLLTVYDLDQLDHEVCHDCYKVLKDYWDAFIPKVVQV